MEVIERSQSSINSAMEVIWHPHPILPTAQRKTLFSEVTPGSTIREILAHSGIDAKQPIVVILDDRLLSVVEWDSICPSPGQIINVKACVSDGGGGGGGGSNPVQMVAMIAIIAVAIAAPYMAPAAWGLLTAAGAPTMLGAMMTAGIMMAGSLVISSVFAASNPSTDNSLNGASGQYSQGSPTYSLSGGSNRMRPYESMPVVMGIHRFFPDLAARPYVEFQGEDQYLHQIFHLGLSRAEFSNWKIGTNPITNYQDYFWSHPNTFGKITDFPGNVDGIAGADLVQSAGWIVRTTSGNTYRIGIDIEGILYYANDRGGLDNTSVQIRVQYKSSGSSTWLEPTSIMAQGNGFIAGHYGDYNAWIESGEYQQQYDGDGGWYLVWVDTSHYETRSRFVAGAGGTIIISGSSQTPKRSTLFIDVPIGTYDVRIIRDTADSSDSRLQNKTSWSMLRSYQEDLASYVGQNRIGLTIRASEQLNGAISQLSVDASAFATYWDGSSWVTAKTSNPAHWFMYFAVGDRDPSGALNFGVGQSIDQLNLPELHSWGLFCDREGLTWDAVLDGSQGCEDILNAIARCGFASPSRASGRLSVIWDERNLPVSGAYGMSNIISGSFEVSYITEQLADEIIVRFDNIDRDWIQDEVRVSVPGVTNPTRTSTIDLLGCIRPAMAGKFANYLAAQQHYRKRRIKWDCDFEGFVNRRGDVVLLAHDLTQWAYSGRIVSIDGKIVTLDRDIPRNGSLEYLMIKKPNGTLTTYTVLPGSEFRDTVELTITPNLQSEHDFVDHMWFFSPLETPGKKVKILSVKPLSNSRLTIIATDEYPEFYAAWDGSWNSSVQNTLLVNSIPSISNISSTEMLYRGVDSSIKSHIAISWIPRGSYEKANIRYRVNETGWKNISSNSTSYEFDTDISGLLEVEILPIYGISIGEKKSYSTWILGVLSKPTSISGLTDFFRDGKTVLSWRAISDPRDIDYEVRKGNSWDKSQVLGRVLTTEFITDGNGTYWVSPRAGNIYAEYPQSIVISDASLVSNVIATYDEEQTNWSGSVSNGAVVFESNVVLSGSGYFSQIQNISSEPSIFYYGGISHSGYYEIPVSHHIDIGKSQACNVSVSYRLSADNPFNLFSKLPNIASQVSIAGNYAGFADCKIEMAIAPDSGIYGQWRDFIPGAYMGRKFKFRANLISSDPSITAILDTIIFSVDMPDRVDSGVSIPCPSTGLSILYSPKFQVSPSVQVTILNALPGDDVVLSSATATGFNVQITNAGSPVARNINWLSQGY